MRLSIFRGEELILEHELIGRQIALGRHPDNDIVLEDRTLSRFHARLETRGEDDYVVVALPNQNGVFVNGIRVEGERDLAAGDRIRLGHYVAIYDPPKAAEVGRGRREPTRSDDLKSDITSNFEGLSSIDGDLDLDFDLDSEDGFAGVTTGEIDDLKLPVVTDVEQVTARPRFVLTYNNVEVSRHNIADKMIIGRSKTSDVVISLLGLSRAHVEVTMEDDGAVSVRDLDSQNGTWVNNVRVEGRRRLHHGDILNFYEYALIFVQDEQEELDLPGAEFDLGMPTGTDIDALARRATHARDLKNDSLSVSPPTKRTEISLEDDPNIGSQFDELGLGDGSYLGAAFDDSAEAERNVEGTDLVEADLDFDDELSIDQTTFSGRPSGIQDAPEGGWPTDAALKSCLGASQRDALVSIEVFLDDVRYTQLPLSGPVTRVGSDDRCDLALPPESGIAPWHCTLLHIGASVLCYRAARRAHLELEGKQFDGAVLEDGQEIDLGRVRIVVARR